MMKTKDLYTVKFWDAKGNATTDLLISTLYLHKHTFSDLPISTIYYALRYSPVSYNAYKEYHKKGIETNKQLFSEMGYTGFEIYHECAKQAIYKARYDVGYGLLYDIQHNRIK